MVVRFSRKKSKSASRKTRKTSRSTSRKVPKRLTQEIKTVVRRMAESKNVPDASNLSAVGAGSTSQFDSTYQFIYNHYAQQVDFPLTPATRNIGNRCMGEPVNVIPPIFQGTGEGDRIGNEITTTKFNVNISLCSKIGGKSVNEVITAMPVYPRHVYIYLASLKGDVRSAPTTGYLDEVSPADIQQPLGDLAQLLEAGNSEVGYDGNVWRELFQNNRDKFTIHAHRKVKLSPSFADASNQQVGNNDYKQFVRLTIPVKGMLGKWKYRDINESVPEDVDYIYPTNKGLFLFATYTNMIYTPSTMAALAYTSQNLVQDLSITDVSTPPDEYYQPIDMKWFVNMEYKDL